jgi:hypothetical protein
VINRLRKAGISITAISNTSNLLSINLLNLRDSSVQIWNELKEIREQIVSLKADVAFIRDEHLHDIRTFKNLRKISLAGTQVTDNVIEQLASLKDLSSLNVSESLLTYKGLMSLTILEKLRFLYGIGLKESADAIVLADKLPTVEVITTSFSVPLLATDTTEVKMVK